ncbi:peptidase S9 [Erythrobacter longus]|uniref:Peptidase S9 n=1 Tax=Erythrobacter longus TaxID=1044 RepID=A0A074MCW8_ERYLO|nr:S9 family peptidase [Erythrobacter longus]KEO91324.1 peptidase S9 [Erythrobacter longus]
MKSTVPGLWGLFSCVLLAGSAFTSPVLASEAEEDAKRFGARSSVLDISLSPSGTKLAWIAPGPGHTEQLFVIDMEDGKGVTPISTNSAVHADLSRCEWATDERLVCEIYGMSKAGDGVLVPFTRMFTIGDDGSDVTSLTERSTSRSLGFNQDGGDIVALDIEGEEGRLLMTRNYIPERTTGTRMASSKEGLGVDQIDVENGKRRTELQPDAGADYYIADDKGYVRLKARSATDSSGYVKDSRMYLVRESGKNNWERLADITLNGEQIEFTPAAIDAGSNQLFAYSTINGYVALVGIPLDGSGTAKIIAARDDVDVDGLVRIGRQRRVVGVSYATEKRAVEYFDEELASLAKALGQALPKQPLINFAGASSDESKLIIIASSDTDPGTVYLFDKGAKKLEVLLAMRDPLVDRTMGEMRPITFPASDGTQIPGYLTLPPGSDGKGLPAIVLPHGGPAARDYWGFDWMVQFFTARGFAVLQPNFRGSAGYGEAWFGRNGYQEWDVAIGDVNDAGRWMISEGIAAPDKLAIVGWSYGGYAALQSQVVDPQLYKAVVAIAPVTDLEYLRSDARAYTNFRFRDEQLGRGPHIDAGSPRRHAEKFAAPVALFHGTLDVNVDVRHSKGMADALNDAGKPVTYVEFEDLRHGLRDSDARTRMLGSIDSFLTQSLGR